MIYWPTTDKKVYASLIWILLAVITTYAEIDDYKDEIHLTNFIREYVAPFIESMAPIIKPAAMRMSKESDNKTHKVVSFITQTVENLKTFLQDDDEIDDKITLEGEEETTIVEFIPKVTTTDKQDEEKIKVIENKAKDFQDNLMKYKKLRNKIRKNLKRENISNKTRTLVMKTLDEMIAQMIAHRCSWAGGIKFRASSLTSETTEPAPDSIIHTWSDLWKKLNEKFQSSNNNLGAEDLEKQKEEFLKKFQNLVNMMTTDLNNAIGKYKVVCRYEDIENKGNIRVNNKMDPFLEHENMNMNSFAEMAIYNNKFEDSLPCTNFKLCSEELKEFLLDFYKSLNETAVNTLKTYAAMFSRDVNDDSKNEKQRVVNLLYNIASSSENNVDFAFRKQTKKLKLAKDKNEYINLKGLYNYVASTIKRVKKIIHKVIQLSLTDVSPKLLRTIQKDVEVNMGLDLDNLERDVCSRVCQTFVVCNSKLYSTRKSIFIGDKNNMFVKVEVNLEEDEDYRRTGTMNIESTIYKHYRALITKVPIKLNVTRTTPPENELVVKIEPRIVNVNNINSPKQIHIKDSQESKNQKVKVEIFFEDDKDKEVKYQKNARKINVNQLSV